MTPLIGCIDEVGRGWMHGWARNPSFPDAPICLLVTADDQLLERVVANHYRPDLEQAGIGHGRFGFAVAFSPPLLPSRSWLIHVRSEADGQDVPGSPVRLPASAEFDDEAQAAFAAAIGNVIDEAELDRRIGFLAEQRDRLLQLRSDQRSSRIARNAARVRRTPAVKRRRRALVLDASGVPDPGRDGGSSALVSHMRSLQRLGYEVTFAAADMANGVAGAALERDGISVCHAPWFGSIEEVLRREADGYELVYLHRLVTAAAYTPLVRRHQPRARLIYSVADLHHLRVARQAAYEQRPELMAEARRIRTQELWAAQAADAVITHSAVEAKILEQTVPPERIHVIAWSVSGRSRPPSFARRSGMAFIGNFSHAPNIAAARQLRYKIMPGVQAVAPQIKCKLVGCDLPGAWQAPQPGFDVVGRIEDLSDVFATIRLTVAPMPFGAGLKAKVIESLAAGVPCVCSPSAAEGLDLPAGLRSLVVPDDAAIITAILRLHGDAAYNEMMANLGTAFVRKAFSETRLDRAMRRATGDATDNVKARGPALARSPRVEAAPRERLAP